MAKQKSRPHIFREDSAAGQKAKAQKLSNLENIGPVMEKVLNSVGIKTIAQFRRLGWKKAMIKLSELHPRYQQKIYAEVLLGALRGCQWHQLSENDKKAIVQFIQILTKESGTV